MVPDRVGALDRAWAVLFLLEGISVENSATVLEGRDVETVEVGEALEAAEMGTGPLLALVGYHRPFQTQLSASYAGRAETWSY